VFNKGKQMAKSIIFKKKQIKNILVNLASSVQISVQIFFGDQKACYSGSLSSNHTT
jgi:hypothetical protein